MGHQGTEDAYRTGRGSIIMRAVVQVEELQGRICLVVTELPYQVNPDVLAQKIAELVKDGKVAGVADIRDETSGRTGQRLVIVLKRDAVDLFDLVRNTTDGKIILYGHSIGSFIAASVVQHRKIDGLVLEGTATNVPEWANSLVPWYAKAFVRVSVDPALQDADNVIALAEYMGPLLILVGDSDNQTSPRLARSLHESAATKQKEIVVFPECGHSGVSSSPEFKATLQRFITGRVGA